MNFPRLKSRGGEFIPPVPGAVASGSVRYEDHIAESKRVQRKADIYLMIGGFLMGTLVLGVIGFPIFLALLTLPWVGLLM